MHVSYGLDDGFPPSLPFEIALGDILAKAIAMSAQALQSLPKDQRLLIIGTTPIHGGLLVFIKHAVSPDIPDDKKRPPPGSALCPVRSGPESVLPALRGDLPL